MKHTILELKETALNLMISSNLNQNFKTWADPPTSETHYYEFLKSNILFRRLRKTLEWFRKCEIKVSYHNAF